MRLLMTGACAISEWADSCMMHGFRATPVRPLEIHMRKGALLLALVFAVAAATSADAAKRAAKPAADPAMEAQKNSAAFFGDMFHPWAPSATMKQAKVKGKKKKM
jgi:hypothetical protein